MTQRTDAFMTALADLMEEHGVTMSVREVCDVYSHYVDGIDVDFEVHPCETVELPSQEVDAETIRRRVGTSS